MGIFSLKTRELTPDDQKIIKRRAAHYYYGNLADWFKEVDEEPEQRMSTIRSFLSCAGGLDGEHSPALELQLAYPLLCPHISQADVQHAVLRSLWYGVHFTAFEAQSLRRIVGLVQVFPRLLTQPLIDFVITFCIERESLSVLDAYETARAIALYREVRGLTIEEHIAFRARFINRSMETDKDIRAAFNVHLATYE